MRRTGSQWEFRTAEHGGDEPDNMPQVIKAIDAGHYVPLTRDGKIVVSRVLSELGHPTAAN
jgi:hypothetical protein